MKSKSCFFPVNYRTVNYRNEIDDVISTKILDEALDLQLIEVVTKTRIYEPCEAFFVNLHCMTNGNMPSRSIRECVLYA